MKITKIEAENGNYNVTLNNVLTVRNISLKDGTSLQMPVYRAKGGKTYKQFSLLSRDYGAYFTDAVKNKKVSAYSGKTEVKINKFSKAVNQKSIRAFASVIFEDKLEVECRVMETRGRRWVAWPSHQKDGKWSKDFIFEDSLLKNRSENLLIEEYKKNE